MDCSMGKSEESKIRDKRIVMVKLIIQLLTVS
jgi:hypothetical protein